MTWPVPAEWVGDRADKVLAHVSGRSRADARRALEEETVTVDGTSVAARYRVAEGDTFVGEIPDRITALEPERVTFGVALEDQHLAVIEKPPGVVTHPGAGRQTGTLAGGLLHRWPEIRGVGVENRWGIVHRLDRDTSGLLVVALTTEAYEGLSEAIRMRRVTREYLCLVGGSPPSPTGTIEAPIMRDPHRPMRMRIDAEGRPAVTHYRVERSWNGGALLRVILETGRTHQIRVHMTSIGLPVAGDRTYGDGSKDHRLFLHATRLAFDHPVTGRPIDIESPLPEDLASVLRLVSPES
jgi:23S rRNA pseudouridine1911/1915/1917 synthase